MQHPSHITFQLPFKTIKKIQEYMTSALESHQVSPLSHLLEYIKKHRIFTKKSQIMSSYLPRLWLESLNSYYYYLHINQKLI